MKIFIILSNSSLSTNIFRRGAGDQVSASQGAVSSQHMQEQKAKQRRLLFKPHKKRRPGRKQYSARVDKIPIRYIATRPPRKFSATPAHPSPPTTHTHTHLTDPPHTSQMKTPQFSDSSNHQIDGDAVNAGVTKLDTGN